MSSETRPISRKLKTVIIVTGAAYIVFEFFADAWTYWIDNALCFRYLGCNAGFFGYDAAVHFLAGVFEAVLLVWLCQRFPRFCVLHEDSIRKNILVIVSLVVLLTLGWELWEFSVDHLRMDVLGENLSNPNVLGQPSGSDTMGDFAFGAVGALVGALVVKRVDPASLLMHASV